MYLISDTFEHYGWMPERVAFGKHHPTDRFTFAGNRSPHLAWGDVPDGTRSFALLCVDKDAPTKPDDVNQEGREVPPDLPRADFWHWSLLDIPSSVRELAEGAHASEVVQGGKSSDDASIGVHGINDYTSWFADTEGMKGRYYGYDGPAPPWNDSRIHGYHFQIFALDVPSTGMHGSFTGGQALKAIRSHILGSATLVGLYAINPRVREAYAKAL